MVEQIVNFSEPRERAAFVSATNKLTGTHRITIKAHRKRRSDRQNRYYFPCFVAPFAQFLRDQGQSITDLDAHEILKFKFLRATCINPETGEAFDYTRSSTDLTTLEFYDYLERVAAWLADEFHIVVPEASLDRPPAEQAA